MARPQKHNRGVVYGLYAQGFECKEIASTLDIPLNTVYSIITQAGLKPNKTDVKKTIEILASKGLTRKQISEKLGFSYNYVSQIIRENDIAVNRPKKDSKRDPELEKRIVELITSGHSERYTAKTVGCANTTVHKVKVKYGLLGMETTVTLGDERIGDQKREEIRWRLLQCGFDLVEYKSRRHPITFRCVKCDCVFTRDATVLYKIYSGEAGCPGCAQLERDERARKKEAEKRAQQQARREAKQEAKRQLQLQAKIERERIKAQKMQESHICECCGRPYTIEESGYNSTKYCSKRCQQRVYYRKHDQVRDHRKRWRKHDSDITLEKLFKRDSGRCYICGERCDWTDKIINENGTHIAGNRYPSIDHVFPLSKGGTDTWDNIKLAHRICNSLKRDKEGYNGKT